MTKTILCLTIGAVLIVAGLHAHLSGPYAGTHASLMFLNAMCALGGCLAIIAATFRVHKGIRSSTLN